MMLLIFKGQFFIYNIFSLYMSFSLIKLGGSTVEDSHKKPKKHLFTSRRRKKIFFRAASDAKTMGSFNYSILSLTR